MAELRPRWVVIENVFGLLSSNGGRDMGAILGALGDLGYGYAYTVLDSQWFGVAQRRRRVFIVAKLGDGTGPAQVLFEPESGIRDTPPSREARTGVTPLLEVGARTNTDGRRDGDGIGESGDPMFTLQASKQHGIGFEIGPQGGALTDVAPTLDTRARNGPVQNQVGAGVIVGWPAEVASTLNAHFGEKQGLEDQHINQGAPLFVPAVAKSLKAGGNDRHCESHETYIPVVQEVANTLTSRHNSSPDGLGSGFTVVPDVLPFDTTQVTSVGNYSNPQPGDPCHPLAATAHPPAVAYGIRAANTSSNGWGIQEEVSHTLDTGPRVVAHGYQGEDASHTIRTNPSKADKPDSSTYVVEPVAVSTNQRGEGRLRDVHGSLTASRSAKKFDGVITAGVRRLTPRECERLQGFPDDFTKLDDKTPDGSRYRTMGNAVTTTVAKWIGERIMLVDQQREEKANV